MATGYKCCICSNTNNLTAVTLETTNRTHVVASLWLCDTCKSQISTDSLNINIAYSKSKNTPLKSKTIISLIILSSIITGCPLTLIMIEQQWNEGLSILLGSLISWIFWWSLAFKVFK